MRYGKDGIFDEVIKVMKKYRMKIQICRRYGNKSAYNGRACEKVRIFTGDQSNI